MKVLFFIEPKIERNDPYFRFPTIRHSLIPQMEALRSEGHETFLIFGAHLAGRLAAEGLDARLGPHGTIKDSQLSAVSPNYRDLAHKDISRSFTEDELKALRSFLLPAIGDFAPEMIVIWESAAEYLRMLFPNAKIVYELPGPFSRAPFPDYTLFLPNLLHALPVPDGLTHEGTLNQLRKELLRGPLIKPAIARRVSALRATFKRLVLFALQIDHYFMVDEVLRPYGSQLGALDFILSRLPADVGLIVTMYRSRAVSTDTMTEANLRYLRETYPNFIFDDELNAYENVSQALVPLLDGVIVASSSVGFQAALWQKPLLCLGPSHLSAVSSARDIVELVDQVDLGVVVNRDSQLAYVVDRHSIPTVAIQSDPKRYFSLLTATADGCEKSWDGHIDVGSVSETLSQGLRLEASLSGTIEALPFQGIREVAKRRPVMSFDIFDTLLVRPLAAPSDLFRLMNGYVEQRTGRRHIDFPAIRRAAEKTAFQNAIAQERREILLREIYDEIAGMLDIPDEVASDIMNEEADLEARLLYPRSSISTIFHEAVADGKEVHLISDMYLPEDMLSSVLNANGIKGYRSLFLSSSQNAKKQSGELFKVFKAALDAPVEHVLHIGDNEVGDFRRAEENGIKSAHINRPWDTLKQSWYYEKVWKRDEERHSLSLRTMLAVIANECFDDPEAGGLKRLFPRGRYDLGFAGFGPFLLSYTHWLIKRARKNGIKKLYFLARDGLVMKQAYDIVARHVPDAPSSAYLYCSRRCANVAKLKTMDDVIDLLMVDISIMSIERLIEVRFGLSSAAIEQMGNFPDYQRLRKVRVNNETRHQAMPVLQELKDVILENAKQEREAYLAYLQSAGFLDDLPKAVVDVGYAGTMQESLYDLIDRREKISGFYLVTFRTALARCESKGLPTEGFFGNFIDRHDTHLPFCRHIPLYESFFSNDQASLQRYRKAFDGRSLPVFQPETPGEAERRIFSRQVHQGALDFVTRFSDVFGDIQFRFDLEPMKSLRVLREYFASPTAADAQLMAGLVFEDNYGAGMDKVILRKSNSGSETSVWVQGDNVLYPSTKAVPEPKSIKPHSPKPASLRWRKIFVKPVRPFVKVMGSKKDLKIYDKNPVQFFRDLKEPHYRFIGRVIFGGSA